MKTKFKFKEIFYCYFGCFKLNTVIPNVGQEKLRYWTNLNKNHFKAKLKNLPRSQTGVGSLQATPSDVSVQVAKAAPTRV